LLLFIDEVSAKISGYVKEQLIITVAAGIDPTFMEARLPKGTPVCWMMPNTAAQVQKSMTTYVCGGYVTNEHREVIHYILESIGEIIQEGVKATNDHARRQGS
jgi:pyrroline-5-carboxylate reductase